MTGLVDIEIIGDSRDAERRLMALQHSFSDTEMMKWLAAGVDPIIRGRIEALFDNEGSIGGGTKPWAPLAAGTVEIRKSKGFPGEHPINQRTGSMKRHLLDDPPRVVPHSVGVTMWSPGSEGSGDVPNKVRVAQQGGTTPEGSRVPARPVLGVDIVDLEIILLSLAGHIAAGQPGGASINGGIA